MPYAANNKVSKSPFDGAIEISEQEYADGRAALIAGKIVCVRDGELKIYERAYRTVYAEVSGEPLRILQHLPLPEGYSEDAPEPEEQDVAYPSEVILRSPDGTPFKITVDDDGNVNSEQL